METLGPLIVDIAGTALSDEDKQVLSHPLVGGIILFSRNFESIDQLQQLVQAIKALRRPQLMISVDHEGGRVQRFKQGFTKIPDMGSIGQWYDDEPVRALAFAKTCGWLLAIELKAVGVDVSYAPVLDIDRQLNTVIGNRSFHQQVESLVALAMAFIDGMHAADMLAIGKHFPGHGGISEDSHLAIPSDMRRFEDISESDMRVFKQLIEKNYLAGIMPAHICYPSVDPLPTTFSSKWLQTILRQQLKYQGLIFSDDLSMEGASVAGDYPSRVHQALEAGCDIILLCNKREKVLDVLEKCADINLDLSASIKPFTTSCDMNLTQLQQLESWQAASQHVQQFIERGVTTC